jgi:TPR repeat protein
MSVYRRYYTLLITLLLLLPAGFCFAETEYEKGWDNFKAGNYSLARKIWLPLAKEGDGDAALGLAIIYENGLQTPKDTRESTRWYQVAADKDIAEAQHDLGIKHFTGSGVPKDLNKTYQLWKGAAEKGLGSAQSKLAYLYLQGLGTPKNDAEALRWYRQAANQGNTEGMYNLSLMYKRGTGTEINNHQYHYWLEQAAEMGYAPAQYDLGLIILYGKDMERSVSGGKNWLIKAANNGHADSQYYLGTLYMNGHILRPDKEKAITLLTAAAKQGHQGAKQSLVDMKYQKIDTSTPLPSAKPTQGTNTVSASAAQKQKPKGVVLSSSLVDKQTTPAAPPVSKATPGADRTQWLGQQRTDQYLIQLLASQDKAGLKNYIKKLPASINAYTYRYRKDGQLWTAVATGIFNDRKAAKKAVARLPANIRKNKPWIRPIGPIQKKLAN